MAYSEEIKSEVKERLSREESVKSISEKMKISASTIYKWKRELETEIHIQEVNKEEETETHTQEAKREEEIHTQETKREETKQTQEELSKVHQVKSESRRIENQKVSKVATKFINRIRTKLYFDKIEKSDIEEIMNSKEISESQRIYILLAICEKQKNSKQAKQIIEKCKAESIETVDNKTLNLMMQRIENKKVKIFDYAIYDQKLRWKLDEELKKRYEQEEKAEKQEKITLREQQIARSKATSKKVEGNNGNVRNQITEKKQRQEENRSFKERMKVSVNHTNRENVQAQPRKQPNHYTEIVEYLTEKRKTIYLKMQSENSDIQRSGISQWDRMEVLMDEVNKNKNNKEYLNQLYSKITQLKAKENGIER